MISPTLEHQSVGTNQGGVYRAGLRFLAKITSLDPEVEEVQAWIIEETRQLLDAKSVSLYLYDDSKPDTLNKMSQSAGELFNSQLIPLDGNQMVLEVMETGNQRRTAGESKIFTPLVANDETIGVIELEFVGETFDADVLAVICESIAINLARSRRSRRTQEKIEGMQTFQDQLLNSRNTLRALFDSSPSSIYIIDPAYNLVAINMRRADLAGKVPRELVGKRCFDVLHQREAPCPGCLVE